MVAKELQYEAKQEAYKVKSLTKWEILEMIQVTDYILLVKKHTGRN